MPKDALREALRNVGFIRDGRRCWCKPGWTGDEHQGQCIAASEALAAAPPAEPRERENRIPQEPDADDWLKLAEEQWYDGDSKGAIGAAIIAIAERLDALRRTIAAAHGLCIQCMERPRLEALRICGTCYRIGVPHGQDAA